MMRPEVGSPIWQRNEQPACGIPTMLRLSDKWAPILGSQPETGMGYQVVSVTLKDGRQFDDVRVVGGVVTRVGDAAEIPFRDDEIQLIECTHGAHRPPSNWHFEVVESSAGVYRATGRDALGHRVDVSGTNPDALIAECRAMALRLASSRADNGLAKLPWRQSFLTVAELRVFLCDLAGWLDTGRLTQIGSQTLSPKELLETDSRPDVIECEFQDEQGRRYRLFVDTYHGTGGDWQQIE